MVGDKYTCVELEARLVGEDLQLAARRRMTDNGHQPRGRLPLTAHHKVVIETRLISFCIIQKKSCFEIGKINICAEQWRFPNEDRKVQN